MSFLAGKVTRRTLHSFFTFCNVLTPLLCLYAVTNPRWYGAVDDNTATGLSISPWYACVRTNDLWRCEEFIFTDLAPIDECGVRTEATIRSWVFAIRAMVILTGLSAAIAGILATSVSPMGPNSRKGARILLGFSVSTFVFNIIGIIISAVFFATKVYCTDGFCSVLQGDCKKKFFHGALVYYIGIIVPFVSIITSIVLVCTHGQAPPSGQLTQQPKAVDHNEPTEMQQHEGQPYAYPTSEQEQGTEGQLEHIYQPPEGEDWEWDPNSQMYWSEARYMFFRTTDGWFYEPNSQQWYDPTTQQWIADAPQ